MRKSSTTRDERYHRMKRSFPDGYVLRASSHVARFAARSRTPQEHARRTLAIVTLEGEVFTCFLLNWLGLPGFLVAHLKNHQGKRTEVRMNSHAERALSILALMSDPWSQGEMRLRPH